MQGIFSRIDHILGHKTSHNKSRKVETISGFLVAQMVKNPPVMQETQVQPLGWEDPLEKRMATHS